MSPPQSKVHQTINHFSHLHPLHLLQSSSSSSSSSCSGCNLIATGLIYTCTSCNYFLHQKCSQMPSEITHPFHKEHVFSLLPKPQYQNGFFTCDACGKLGQGFSYHCKSCDLDIHILCATMPLSLNHNSHFHTLELIFSPPYGDKMFNCDVCNTRGLNHWLYRCKICGFDAHLDCANTQIQQPRMVSSTGGSTIPAPHESATGIPLQQFMPNQGVEMSIEINGSVNNSEYMVFRQRVNQLSAGGYLDNYNRHYQQQALMANGGYGRGCQIGGSGGVIAGRSGGQGGGLGGGGGGGVLGGIGVGAMIGLLTGLPLGNDAITKNLLKSIGGGGGGSSSGESGGGLDSILGGGGGFDGLGGGGDFLQGDIFGGFGGI